MNTYPRVSKPELCGLLEKYGTNGKRLESLIDLHECTEYKVRGKVGLSETWRLARVLREGCSTSLTLLHVYQQAVMRQVELRQREQGGDVGVCHLEMGARRVVCRGEGVGDWREGV